MQERNTLRATLTLATSLGGEKVEPVQRRAVAGAFATPWEAANALRVAQGGIPVSWVRTASQVGQSNTMAVKSAWLWYVSAGVAERPGGRHTIHAYATVLYVRRCRYVRICAAT